MDVRGDPPNVPSASVTVSTSRPQAGEQATGAFPVRVIERAWPATTRIGAIGGRRQKSLD